MCMQWEDEDENEGTKYPEPYAMMIDMNEKEIEVDKVRTQSPNEIMKHGCAMRAP